MNGRPIIVYLLIYGSTLLVMSLRTGFSPAEPLIVLLVFGLGLSVLALWSTQGITPHDIPVKFPQQETPVLGGYVLIAIIFITWGLPAVRLAARQPLLQGVLVTLAKLIVFVILPYFIWRLAWRYPVSDFTDWRRGLRGQWRPLAAVSLALLALQFLLGRARNDLAALHPGAFELLAAALLTGMWLFFEVGVVEEFFFRGLLQSRVAALLDSETAGLVIMALVFGLAHAPGFYLRPELAGEMLGARPTLLTAFGYAIVMTSVTGFFLGVLWIRTRNLLLLALVHAAGDLLPNLAATLRLWHPGG